MRYNQLGNTGLVVSELCLGTMTFGQSPGRFAAIAGLDAPAAKGLVKQALDAGINFIDTANVYSGGESEVLTGRALRELGVARGDVIVATKAAGPMGEGPNNAGMSRRHLLEQIDASLGRLGLDHVDLYQIHAWDPLTPIEEACRALDDIVTSGRARYIGVSNWAAWRIMKALGVSERLNLARFASVQAYYTVAGRDLERELAPMMRSEGLGLMVWSPLAGGLLSGKYTRDNHGGHQGEGRRAAFDFPPVQAERGWDVIEVCEDIARARGCSVAQVALAWLLYQPVVSTVIVGAKSADQLADNIGACAVELSVEDLTRLEKASALPAEYPGWMIDMQSGYRAHAASPRRHPLGE